MDEMIEELMNNEELVSLFDDLYSKQHPDIYDGIRAANEAIVDDYERGMAIFSSLSRKVLGYNGSGNVDEFKMKSIMRSGRFRLLCLLQERSENLDRVGPMKVKKE